MTTHTLTSETLDHWIGGAADPGSGDRTGPVYDPALGEVARQVRYGTAEDVDRAVGVARAAFEGPSGWGKSSIAKRQQVMFAWQRGEEDDRAAS